MLHIPGLLDAGRLAAVRAAIAGGEWVDGRATAGHQSRGVKRNRQLPDDAPAARAAGAIVLAALQENATFVAAALPARIVPPLFNRHGVGDGYGAHIDGAVRELAGHVRLRTDLAATVFLTPPEDYDGGALAIVERGEERAYRLAAGDMLLYPATHVHRVTPVRRGERVAAFFWIQSLVRDAGRRCELFDLDRAIQALSLDLPDHPALVSLTGHYHNLVRMWADM